MKTTFPLEQIHSIRRQASEASRVSYDGPEDWSISAANPMDMFAVFESLQLKVDYTLRAYQFRSNYNGNGAVWAMKADSPFPEPNEIRSRCPNALRTPKPPDALDNLMEAVEGDGTPWSYMCASIFLRQAREFNAMWHGCSWSAHQILDANPIPGPGDAAEFCWPQETKNMGDDLMNMTLRDAAKLVAYLRKVHQMVPTAKQQARGWNWKFCPRDWLPCCIQEGDSICIQFYTYTGENPESIFRHSDRYQRGSYVCQSKCDIVAVGSGGYVC